MESGNKKINKNNYIHLTHYMYILTHIQLEKLFADEIIIKNQ